MSIKLIQMVFGRQFNSTQKLVALKLADCANDDGSSVYPSIVTIARQTGLSVRAVRNSMKAFRESGLLKVVKGGGGRNLSTRYRVDLTILEALPEATQDASGNETDGSPKIENPARGAPFQDQNPARGAVNPARGAPNPSLPVNSIPYGDAEAPLTVNAQIWKEGTVLLQTNGIPNSQTGTILGRWCKRAPSEEKKTKLLAAIRAAMRAGTGDPTAYIEAAIKAELPPPANPRQFTRERWAAIVQAAIKFNSWERGEWGPPPGTSGCLMPKDFHSSELLAALSERKNAA